MTGCKHFENTILSSTIIETNVSDEDEYESPCRRHFLLGIAVPADSEFVLLQNDGNGTRVRINVDMYAKDDDGIRRARGRQSRFGCGRG